MAAAPFSAPAVNTPHAALHGEADLPDGSQLIWALSRREMGPMSFGDRPVWDVASNRLQFLRLWNLKIDHAIAPSLTHSANVAEVGLTDRGMGAREPHPDLADVDALVTRDPNVVLMTTHADCLPVWLCCPESGWIGMAHVGWRGLLAGILENFVNAIPVEHRAELHLAAGPGIGVAHYEVGDDVANRFLKKPQFVDAVIRENGTTHLDMLAGVKAEAARLNVPLHTAATADTYAEDHLSSFRREGSSFWPMGAIIVRVGGR